MKNYIEGNSEFLFHQISSQVIRYGGKDTNQHGVSAPWVVLDEYTEEENGYSFQFMMLQIINGSATQTAFNAKTTLTENEMFIECTDFNTISGESTTLSNLRMRIQLAPSQGEGTRYLLRQTDVNQQFVDSEIGIYDGKNIAWTTVPKDIHLATEKDIHLATEEDYLKVYVLMHRIPKK